MPVDPHRVDAIAQTVAHIYREGETALLKTVTARLATGLERSDWQTSRLANVATLRRQAARIANALAWSGSAAIRNAVARGYRSGNADAVGDLAGLVSDRGPAAVVHAAGSAAERSALAIQSLAEASVRELRPLYSAILPQVDDVYRRAIVGAAARKLTGASTMREAAQAAYQALVSRGITGYTDTAGRRWRLTTYVEMAVRTAVQRAATVGLVDQYTAAGIRLVSVDDQPGECWRCRPFEHQVLALWGATGDQYVDHWRTGDPVQVHVLCTLAEAQAAGLMHPHCRHSIRPYLPGVSMLIKQGRTADPAGEAARERQRAIERNLRYWRELAEAALTDDARARANAKIRAWDAAMAAHIKATGLTRQRYREQIGAGIIPPAHKSDDLVALIGPNPALPGL